MLPISVEHLAAAYLLLISISLGAIAAFSALRFSIRAENRRSEHLVRCPKCRISYIVPRDAPVARCPSCSTVRPLPHR